MTLSNDPVAFFFGPVMSNGFDDLLLLVQLGFARQEAAVGGLGGELELQLLQDGDAAAQKQRLHMRRAETFGETTGRTHKPVVPDVHLTDG